VKRESRASIRKRFQKAGKRLTAERELLFDIVSRHPHLDATAIYQLALKADPKIGQATVYRTLNLLAELGIVDVSNLGEAHAHYELRADDHAHLVCLDCGSVREIPPPRGLRALDDLDGFDVRQTTLELVGYCPKCLAKRRSDATTQDENA
jgi:Fur family ferric uptake transcriptional regulator